MYITMQDISPYIEVAEEVATALHEKRAVIALESTVISHGLPYPANIEASQAMEQVIREQRAVPATIGIRNGKIKIGLSPAEITHLASAPAIQKVSRRDLSITLATGQWGATTVAGTMLCASMAGIRFFATGGIGGVHRGATASMDISADLMELSRTPVMVVCAGAKSILDIDLTLEYLETQGVPVIGWQTDEFPAFYARSSGHRLSHHLDDEAMLARMAQVQWECSLNGIIVGCPIPEQFALAIDPLETATGEALHQAQIQDICGAAVTPFVLAKVAELTGGESIEANKALLVNNAQWAARFASTYYNLL